MKNEKNICRCLLCSCSLRDVQLIPTSRTIALGDAATASASIGNVASKFLSLTHITPISGDIRKENEKREESSKKNLINLFKRELRWLRPVRQRQMQIKRGKKG